MSNLVAICLGLLLLAALAADIGLNGGAAMQFLLQKLIGAIDWLIFWH